MKTDTFLPLPSATSTCAAGNWRDQSAFLFVAGSAFTQTLSNNLFPSSPNLIDALDALEAIEDEFDTVHARAALVDPAERPAIPWEHLRNRVDR